jgi:hypothetical protein
MRKSKLIFISAMMILACTGAMAQPNGGGQGSGGSAPVDGGVVMLVAGIAAYGSRIIRRDRLRQDKP